MKVTWLKNHMGSLQNYAFTREQRYVETEFKAAQMNVSDRYLNLEVSKFRNQDEINRTVTRAL